MDKESHLNLRQVPENFLPALEQHLSEMESAKKSGSQPRYAPPYHHQPKPWWALVRNYEGIEVMM